MMKYMSCMGTTYPECSQRINTEHFDANHTDSIVIISMVIFYELKLEMLLEADLMSVVIYYCCAKN